MYSLDQPPFVFFKYTFYLKYVREFLTGECAIKTRGKNHFYGEEITGRCKGDRHQLNKCKELHSQFFLYLLIHLLGLMNPRKSIKTCIYHCLVSTVLVLDVLNWVQFVTFTICVCMSFETLFPHYLRSASIFRLLEAERLTNSVDSVTSMFHSTQERDKSWR